MTLTLRPLVSLAPSGQCRHSSTAPPPAPFEWRALLSPRALFKRVRELGPAAIGLYIGLWVAPLGAVFSTAMLLDAPDPLILLTDAWPAGGEGFRSAVSTLGGWLDLELLPPPGVRMDARVSAGLWAYLVTDLVEPLRLVAVLVGTPKLVAAWRARGGGGGAPPLR